MATYVLVHGGAHGGWCYRRVTPILRAAGHDVYSPTLTGLGERSHLLGPGVDLDLHIRDVVSVLHYEDLHDVILVGHSYGGMVITGVGDRAPDRVGRLVYLDAANPTNGQSLVDVAGPIIEATRPLGQVVDGVELVLVPGPGAGAFYGVTDPEDIAWMDERLSGHPWKCFEQPLELTNESALWAIPQYHIVCSSTLATRDPELVATARSAGRLFEIDTGHDLMITEPEKVAEALLEIAGAPPGREGAAPASPQTLAAKQAITEVLYRYCHAVDRLDPVLGSQIWHPDGLAHYEGIFEGTGQEFIEMVFEQHRQAEATSHQLANVLIEVDGDRATSESYVTACLRIGGSDIVARGRYSDTWSQREGRWRIDERRYRHDIMQRLPVNQESGG